jgi:hypothetical protein
VSQSRKDAPCNRTFSFSWHCSACSIPHPHRRTCHSLHCNRRCTAVAHQQANQPSNGRPCHQGRGIATAALAASDDIRRSGASQDARLILHWQKQRIDLSIGHSMWPFEHVTRPRNIARAAYEQLLVLYRSHRMSCVTLPRKNSVCFFWVVCETPTRQGVGCC